MATVTGGDKAAAALAKIATKVSKGAHVRVGFLESAKYPDGTSVAMVAAIQEFGAPRVGIPPRPYFRTMIAAKKASWGPAMKAILKTANYDSALALDLIGQGIAGDLRQSIVDLVAPPLGAVTLMIRWMKWKNPSLRDAMSYSVVVEARARVAAGKSSAGVSTKPLIDTGVLLGSVDHEVILN